MSREARHTPEEKLAVYQRMLDKELALLPQDCTSLQEAVKKGPHLLKHSVQKLELIELAAIIEKITNEEEGVYTKTYLFNIASEKPHKNRLQKEQRITSFFKGNDDAISYLQKCGILRGIYKE